MLERQQRSMSQPIVVCLAVLDTVFIPDLLHSLCLMPNTHRRRDETVLSRRRRRRRCEHNSQLAHDDCRRIRSTIWKLSKQTPQGLITPILTDIDNFFNNDVIMSSLLKKLSISIKIHVVKQLRSLFGKFSTCRPNPSVVVVSQLRIEFTPPTPTRQNSFVASASAVCIGHQTPTRLTRSAGITAAANNDCLQ